MDLGLKGKAALVAGASSGLGLAAARALFAEGVRVAMCSRNEERITKAAWSISKKEDQVLPVVCDLTRPTDIDNFVKVATDAFDTIDIVLTNAGGPPLGQHDTVDPEMWTMGYNLTFMSAIRLIERVVPGMKKHKFGRIILSTSLSAKQPIDNLLLSNTYRSGLLGYAKTISRELAPHGITVNTVMPGYTKTERLNYLAAGLAEKTGRSADDIFAEWENKIPVGRLGKPEEYGSLVAFLASERAGFMTGGAFAVDGGQAAGIL
jgi:3-oxoacyl-[acyl-carrier protein] reductase